MHIKKVNLIFQYTLIIKKKQFRKHIYIFYLKYFLFILFRVNIEIQFSLKDGNQQILLVTSHSLEKLVLDLSSTNSFSNLYNNKRFYLLGLCMRCAKFWQLFALRVWYYFTVAQAETVTKPLKCYWCIKKPSLFYKYRFFNIFETLEWGLIEKLLNHFASHVLVCNHVLVLSCFFRRLWKLLYRVYTKTN